MVEVAGALLPINKLRIDKISGNYSSNDIESVQEILDFYKPIFSTSDNWFILNGIYEINGYNLFIGYIYSVNGGDLYGSIEFSVRGEMKRYSIINNVISRVN